MGTPPTPLEGHGTYVEVMKTGNGSQYKVLPSSWRGRVGWFAQDRMGKKT